MEHHVALNHPLAEAMVAIVDQLHAMGHAITQGQATWSFDGQPLVSARFAKPSKMTAHQELSYVHGQSKIEDLLHGLTTPMQSLPALASAPFHWTFSVANLGKGDPLLRLCYADTTVAGGNIKKVRSTIIRLVDTLAQRPAHKGQTYGIGTHQFPAPTDEDAVLLWTALTHRGVIEAKGIEETFTAMRITPLTHIIRATSALQAAVLAQVST